MDTRRRASTECENPGPKEGPERRIPGMERREAFVAMLYDLIVVVLYPTPFPWGSTSGQSGWSPGLCLAQRPSGKWGPY